MGFYDRDYYRQQSSNRFGTMQTWSITTWLIVINVAIFLLDVIGNRFLYRWGYFSGFKAISHLQLWRFLTFQFLHANINHILFNMIALYFFGPMVEEYLGPRRYLAFYLLCGVGGALSYLILMAVHVLNEGPYTQLVGASAGIFGVLIAAATRVAPNATVMLLFPPIPMRLRVLAWIMIGIAAYTIVSSGQNAGGEAAHLGGAAVGFLLIQRPRLLNVFDPPRRR